MDTQSRTLVVGGGLAGLATATYVARGGRRVTLLEKAPAIGGRAVTDAPQGYALNRGAHAFYTGGDASDVLRELGVTYAAGRPTSVFTLDARGLHEYPTDAMSLFRTSLFSAGEKLEFMRVFASIARLDPTRYAHVSVERWIASTTNSARIRDLLSSTARVNLYSAALDIASADTFLTRLQQTVKYPIHYVESGWQSLVDGLRHVAGSAGVEIRTSAPVARIVFDHARARGVQLHDGEELHATDVVLALPRADAAHLLDTFAPLAGDTIDVPVACLDLALSRLPEPRHPVVFNLQQPLFLTVQSAFTRLAPAGGAVMHAMKQLDPRVPSDPHQDRAELEAFLDVVQPGWRDVVVERHFLPRIAAAGRLPLAADGGLASRPRSPIEGVPNVFLAGDWVGPRGWLLDASLASARAAAGAILSSDAAPLGAVAGAVRAA